MSIAFAKPQPFAVPYAKVLLLGDSGVGKTHAALTFPDPAVIDAEGSIDWFADRFAFEAASTKSFKDVRTLIRRVCANPDGRKTLVVDSLTTIYNALVNAATESRLQEGKDDLRPLDWGRIKRKFSSLIDELYHQAPLHVVCIGWVKSQYAKTGTVIEGRAVKDNEMIVIGEGFDGDKKVDHAFDFIFKLESNDGKKARARVMKSRSANLKCGQVIEDFSWQTLEPFFRAATPAQRRRGMTDAEQIARDTGLFETENRLPNLLDLFKKVRPNEKIADWLMQHVARDLAQRRKRVLTDEEFDAAFHLLNAELAAARELRPKPKIEEDTPAHRRVAHAVITQEIADKKIAEHAVAAEWALTAGDFIVGMPAWHAGTLPMLQAFYRRLRAYRPQASINRYESVCPVCVAPPQGPHTKDCELGREEAARAAA